MRLLITRPAEDAAPLAALLAEKGIDSLIEPLLTIQPTQGPAPNLGGVQALLMTSANGVRAFARLSDARTLPVYAVGEATASAAHDAGFTEVSSASGDVAALAGLVCEKLDPARGSLLHVAGSRIAGDLAGQLEGAGFAYSRAVLYTADKATTLSETAIAALQAGDVDGVVFYSPRTAASFVVLAKKSGLGEKISRLTAYCLSDAVAACAGDLDWARVVVAKSPDQAALIASIS